MMVTLFSPRICKPRNVQRGFEEEDGTRHSRVRSHLPFDLAFDGGGSKNNNQSTKVRASFNSRQDIFTGLLAFFKKGHADETLTALSDTAEWKLTPFAHNTLSRDQMTELIQKQNQYLHGVHEISCINFESLEVG